MSMYVHSQALLLEAPPGTHSATRADEYTQGFVTVRRGTQTEAGRVTRLRKKKTPKNPPPSGHIFSASCSRLETTAQELTDGMARDRAGLGRWQDGEPTLTPTSCEVGLTREIANLRGLEKGGGGRGGIGQ